MPAPRSPLAASRAWLIFEAEFPYNDHMIKNVLNTELASCSEALNTGFFRNGRCETCAQDSGMHTVCALMTREFLDFTLRRGNDLCTQRPEFDFPGLRPGDKWCVCLPRWVEALEAGLTPPIILRATHHSVLEYVPLETLTRHALQPE